MEKWFVISLVIAIIIGAFAISNSEVVEIDLIFTTLEVSQAIVIFISALLGAFVVVILESIRVWKLKRKIKELEKNRSLMEEENDKLSVIIEQKDEEIDQLYNIIEELNKDSLIEVVDEVTSIDAEGYTNI